MLMLSEWGSVENKQFFFTYHCTNLAMRDARFDLRTLAFFFNSLTREKKAVCYVFFFLREIIKIIMKTADVAERADTNQFRGLEKFRY